MKKKNIIIGVIISVFVIGGLWVNSYLQTEQIKETVASIIKEQFEKIEGVSDVSVRDVVYSKVQGNNYVGSAKVDFLNRLYSYNGTKQTNSVSYEMVSDGKSVFVKLAN